MVTRRGKLAALAAVLACLIIVPVTLAAYGGRTSTSPATTAAHLGRRGRGLVRRVEFERAPGAGRVGETDHRKSRALRRSFSGVSSRRCQAPQLQK